MEPVTYQIEVIESYLCFFFIIIIIYIIFSLCNFVIYNLARLCVKNVESWWHYPAE